MLEKIIECFRLGNVFYTKNARDEMAFDEFGEILEKEVTEVISDLLTSALHDQYNFLPSNDKNIFHNDMLRSMRFIDPK